jgi:hypothetical protein
MCEREDQDEDVTGFHVDFLESCELLCPEEEGEVQEASDARVNQCGFA